MVRKIILFIFYFNFFFAFSFKYFGTKHILNLFYKITYFYNKFLIIKKIVHLIYIYVKFKKRKRKKIIQINVLIVGYQVVRARLFK